MRWILLFLFLLAACRTPLDCAELSAEDTQKLLDLAAADQEARHALVEWMQENEGSSSPPLNLAMGLMAADAKSREFLGPMVDAGLWPCRSTDGDEAASAAWILIQHADADPDLQARALALMTPLAEADEDAPVHLE